MAYSYTYLEITKIFISLGFSYPQLDDVIHAVHFEIMDLGRMREGTLHQPMAFVAFQYPSYKIMILDQIGRKY